MKKISHFLSVSLVLALSVTLAQASLLVYEGFSYTLDDDTAITGQATNATGLTGNYVADNQNTASSNFRTTGLTFSSLFFPTTGGALQISTSGSNAVVRLGVALDTGAQTGTLWQSYLVNVQSRDEPNTQLSLITRVADQQTAAPVAERSFQSFANGPTSDTPAIGYTSDSSASTGAALTNDTTYLVLARFTNVGSTLSAETPGEATLWVFTEAGYDEWRTTGNSLESNLAASATWTATHIVESGEHLFNNDRFLQFGSFSPVAGTNISGQIDELRWGTTLEAVAIPEPAAWALVPALIAVLLIVRRRSRR